ncbi:MAG TPA: type II secretion system F family protein [Bdellovibrionota bacterium]|nr:type II secretion system F family protein [Bdellovibrionota bacterium]
MIPLGSVCLFFAIFLVLPPVIRRHETNFRRMESEWLKMVRQGLANEFLFIEPHTFRQRTRWIAFAGLLATLLFRSLLPLAVCLASAWLLPYLFLRLLQRRRRALFHKQFSVVLPQLSSILRAGHTFERAVEALTRTQPPPLNQELELVLKELRLGVSMESALESLLERFPSRDLEIVVRAVGISRRVGSNLAEAFDRVAEMIRARSALRDRLSALTAQGKVQTWVAIAMPIVMTGALQMIAPGYLKPLLTTTTGHLLLALCAIAMTLGGFWIHRICRAELLR